MGKTIVLRGALVLAAALFLSVNAQAMVYTWGARGAPVRQMQQKLRVLGYYNGDASGVFDYETTEAVKKYQADNEMETSGIADEDFLLSMGQKETYKTENLRGENETWILASLIEHYAAEKSYTAKTALGAVALNRVKSPSFPLTTAEVVFDLGFSRAYPSDESIEAAKDALRGFDPSNGALYFWTDSEPSGVSFIKSIDGISFGSHLGE